MDTESNQVRLSAIGIICLAVFAALFVRLWFLQGIDRQEFQVASQSNRLRVLHEEAPRGRILDRNGRVIVDNRTSLVVFLDREPLRKLEEPARDEVFARVASVLTDRFDAPVKASRIEARYNDGRWGPQELVPIVSDVREEVDLYFSERRDEFPGVVVDRRAVRKYPYGSLAAHLLGYVGQINETELAARREVDGEPGGSGPTSVTVDGITRDAKPYAQGDTIGKGGVESAYESDLRGVPGKRVIEVNARGEFVSEVGYTPPRRGDDLWLNIDLDMQAEAERQLEEKILSVRGKRKGGVPLRAPEGSAVVADPRNGAVLVMASYPTYQPADLVNGIPTDLWARLTDENEGKPFFNRALQGAYPPASTFKLFTAHAAWNRLIGVGNERYYDRGTYRLQNCTGQKCEFRNAGGKANGMVDLAVSLTVSSDTYYYRIAEDFWLRRGEFGETPIQDAAEAFGLGRRTGIDLPGETSGAMPTPQKRREAYEARPDLFLTGDWRTGDNLNVSIGQGDVLASPLQLNVAYGAFAAGGARFEPRIAKQVTRQKDVTRPPGDAGNFELVRTIEPSAAESVTFGGQEEYDRMWAGFAGVVQQRNGTAYGAFQANPTAWPMAGKTGTAENKVPQGKPPKADSSLFSAWGPAEPGRPPEYVVTVVIPEAGFGSEAAAPVAFRILQPVSNGTLTPACPVEELERCRAAQEEAAAEAERDARLVGGD